MARKQQENAAVPELQERVVYINRVCKVVKGGTRFALTALVVVGDGNGRVGIGLGKSKEVPVAIKKGVDDAKKNMFSVAITKEGTVPHDIVGEFGAGRVLIMPAAPGTGVIAGGPARAVMELAGIKNVFAKSLGTNNAMNVVKAAADGLQKMQSPVEVAERRSNLRREGEPVMAEAQKTLRVTQIKSSIGYKKDQLATLKSLGLGKIGRSHDLVDNESVRGMIFKVKHLVKVEEL